MSTAGTRVRQLPGVARHLPHVAVLGPVLAAAGFALAVVAFTGEDSGAVSRLPIGSVVVAAAGATALEDPAARTVAASPTPLLVRRAQRLLALTVLVGAWWAAGLAVVHRRAGGVADGALTRELAVLLVIAVAGTAAAQVRQPEAAVGFVGSLAALAWFGASWLPRIRHVPLPPAALDPAASGRLTAVLAASVALFLVLSRDPAARPAAASADAGGIEERAEAGDRPVGVEREVEGQEQAPRLGPVRPDLHVRQANASSPTTMTRSGTRASDRPRAARPFHMSASSPRVRASVIPAGSSKRTSGAHRAARPATSPVA